jgi:SAM-dependent methyltransferase
VKVLTAIRDRFKMYPKIDDVQAVRELTSKQWRTIAARTDTYLAGYRDHPGGQDIPQRRARWLAKHPAFEAASSVLELGCGCGRNLAEMRRQHGPSTAVYGYDISTDAIQECTRILNHNAGFARLDLYQLPHMMAHPEEPRLADVIFTMGVLGHLEPTAVSHLVDWARNRARQLVVLVEEPGYDSVAKGPRAWGAKKNTGDYVLWRHNYERILASAIISVEDLPKVLRAPAATHLYVVRPA